MNSFLAIGVVLGFLIGFAHACELYQRRSGQVGTANAAYGAIWALLLWSLFGAYLLAFWLLGLAGMGLARLRRRPEAGP